MSSDAPDYAHHAVSVLLYRAILSVWARFIASETEWRAVDRNLAEATVSDCACFIVAICVLPQRLTLAIKPTKVIQKQRKTRGSTHIATIKRRLLYRTVLAL